MVTAAAYIPNRAIDLIPLETFRAKGGRNEFVLGVLCGKVRIEPDGSIGSA
jgi:hypothetical protein